jgi:ketol-acid reductoisomerase
MVKLKFGEIIEDVVTRDEFPLSRAREVLRNELIAIIGYGVQGPAQALNLKDNGMNVIVGQSTDFKEDWDRAVKDGWIPGKTLFSIEEAAKKGTIIQYLVSDAAQRAVWPVLKTALNKGDALYFSHGFSITYKEQTGVVPPDYVDVILVAPKGSGTSVRRNFLAGTGINASYAVFQDYTGRAEERTLALGIGIGSGYLFPTTFEKEVFSDLTGERGVLMGALEGIMEAQYKVLRDNGHSPSEAFNETVEELTQSLIRLVDEKGMDWMYSNCSATAQRGALDWKSRFRDAVMPVFRELYERVKKGEETSIVLEKTGKHGYKADLEAELSEMRNSEMWQAGAMVRKLRPG